jgi:glycosyltransferase 2 family protein
MLKKTSGILKFIIGISLISYLFTLIDFAEAAEGFSQGFKALLLTGCMTIVFSFFIMALRLHVVVKKFSKGVFNTFRIFLIGWFFSNVLPTNIAGDGYLVFYYSKKNGSVSEAATLIGLQRLAGIFVIFIYGIFYIIMSPGLTRSFFDISRLSVYSWDKIIFVFSLISLIAFIVFNKKLNKVIRGGLNLLKNISITLKELKGELYFQLLLYSILYQVLRLVGIYLLLRGFGIVISSIDLMFVLFMVTIGSLIPVSIGAVGVQESIFVIGLSVFGVPVTMAVIISLINRIVYIFFALTGGVLFLLSRKTTV